MTELRPSRFILPAALLVLGTLAAYLPKYGLYLFAGLYILGTMSALTIGAVMFWTGKAEYNRSIAEIGRTIPELSQNEREALGLAVPEIRILYGKAQPSLVMLDNTGVEFRFFTEFMEHSNSFQTWAKRDVQGNDAESRDVRRRKWDKLTVWLMERRYLAGAPAGRDTYQWRPGSYEMLYNGLVVPHADKLIGPPARLLQADVERIDA